VTVSSGEKVMTGYVNLTLFYVAASGQACQPTSVPLPLPLPVPLPPTSDDDDVALAMVLSFAVLGVLVCIAVATSCTPGHTTQPVKPEKASLLPSVNSTAGPTYARGHPLPRPGRMFSGAVFARNESRTKHQSTVPLLTYNVKRAL
jgi:hypothetical protein